MSREADFTPWARGVTPALFRRALLLSGDWHQAEDLVQDTLGKLYARWRRLEHTENLDGYAHRTLYHQFISQRRRASSTERPTADLPELRSETADTDLRLDLVQALSTLKPQERCVVVARYLDDRSVAEVAMLIGRTESWVRTTAHRALHRLRQQSDVAVLISPA